MTMTTRKLKVPKDGFLYLIKDHTRGFIKIGFTKDVAGRYNQLRTANAGIELLYSWPGDTDMEYSLHQKYLDRWVDGEWFLMSDKEVRGLINRVRVLNESTSYSGTFYGSHAPQPDFSRIHRVLSRFNYRRPALRSRYLAETETIEHHRL